MQRVKSHHSHHSHHSHGSRHSHSSHHHHSHHSHKYPEDQIDAAVGSLKGGIGGKAHRVIRKSGGEQLKHHTILTVSNFDEEDLYDERMDLDDPGVIGGEDDLRPGDSLFKALANFVPPLPPIIGCPVGLEHLYFANMIIINQSVEAAEKLLYFDPNVVNMGMETANRYDVINSEGKRIYLAIEVAHDCQLFCFGAGRPFQIKLYDFSGHEVLSLWRSCSCLFCLGEVCACTKFGNAVHVKLTSLDETRELGIVRQTPFRCAEPMYNVYTADGSPKYQIVGPSVLCLGCENDNPKFQIFKSFTKTDPVGEIHRIYAGYTREFFTDADLFKLDFPEGDIDTGDKALLLAAVFLIDFLHFEDQCGRGSIIRNNRCRLAILVLSLIALAIIIWQVYDNLNKF